MGTIFEGTIPVKLIITNGLFTCIYVPILHLFLSTFGQLYEIGKINTIYVPTIFLIAEFTKHLINQRLYILKSDKKKTYGLKSVLVILASISIYFTIPILFGAPVLSHHEETFMLALLLTTLTSAQCLLHLGYKSCVCVLGNLIVFDYGLTMSQVVSRNVQFTLIGAWAAAVVIPLDWNRVWQAWPIPCYVGAMYGNLFGNVLSMLLVYKDKKRGKDCSKKRYV